MKNYTLLLWMLGTCAAAPCSLLAHDRHDHQDPDSIHDSSSARTWTRWDSGEQWSGTYLTSQEGFVRIQRTHGDPLNLPAESLIPEDRDWVRIRELDLARLNGVEVAQATSPGSSSSASRGSGAPTQALPFARFPDSVRLRWDDQFLFVESRGMPDHPMMIGIRAWQQQVPLPQAYTGDNAWRIPRNPVPARNPLSAREHFFRGAIAIAANGVPIFNPIKNDGRTDTLLAGELDQWGGHCGRADDYHYHTAPVHLQEQVGPGMPIAYALDGYPILGYQQPGSADNQPLDAFNGHTGPDGQYHYHATRTYPYLNGGFHGEVTERDGQVDPQPRAQGPRPALPPLRGATITGFQKSPDGKSYRVEYQLGSETRSVSYALGTEGSVTFNYQEGRQGNRTETYRMGQGNNRDRGPRPPNGAAPPPRRGNPPPPRNGEPRPPRGRPQAQSDSPRIPWIQVHAGEMDTNQDGVLTREETLAEARNAFAAYDTSKSGIITLEALSSGRQARSAMGGFIREHREELDRNNDGAVSLEEVLSNAARMFDKADSDGDHRLPITASMKELSPKRDSRGKPDQAPTTSTSSTTPASTPTRLPTAKTGSTTPPNIIFILVDDLGWRDAGFTGNTFVETPNVDQLAHEGIHFTQAYSSAPNCAPTRACLMSGQYPPRHGIFTVIDPRHDPGQTHHKVLGSTSQEALDGEVITIAEVLKSAGYSTACFGMWNLGRGRSGPSTPTGQGFDVYKGPRELGFPQNEYFASDGRYLTHALFDEGLRFMEEHRDSPFFLYLAPHAIHSPFEPRPELLAYYQEKARKHTGEKVDPVHAAMVTAVDQEVGRLMTHLCERQLDENTLVVFTSDNGGTPQYVAPLNGSKGALYEGGIRVPCAVWWKGIHSPGRNSDLPILSMDFYPTLAEIAGALLPVNQPTDGISLLPILQNTGIPSREAVFWHFPCYIGRGEPTSAMRAGNWKLIEKFETGAIELYDLSQDPGETHNLTSLKPEQASRLTARLHAWQNQLQAPRPTQPNPAYDPTAVPQRKPRGNSPPKLGKRGKTQRQGS